MGLYRTSFAPVMRSKMPNSLFRSSASMWRPIIEKHAALRHPASTAGKTVEIASVPCRQRKMEEIVAVGIKNSKLSMRAAVCSNPTTKVSQRINRLPPPIPSPAKNPSMQPTTSANKGVFNINGEFLPIGSEYPEACASKGLESSCRRFRRTRLQLRFQADRGSLVSMRKYLSAESKTGIRCRRGV